MTDDIELRLAAALYARTGHVTSHPSPLVALRGHASGRRRSPRRTGAVLAAAASVLAVVVAANAIAPAGDAPADVANGSLSSPPYPTTEHFLAVADGKTVVVRAIDGRTVAVLPEPEGQRLDPVLSPDGSRVYSTWDVGDGTAAVGYLDLQTTSRVELDRRQGLLHAPTVSADGGTLAVEWQLDRTSSEGPKAVIVLDLDTGQDTVLTDAPGGPQVLQFALSPDGTRLAVVPTDRGDRRPLEFIDATNPAGFASPSFVGEVLCQGQDGKAVFDQPRWSQDGLYAYYRCGSTAGEFSGLAVIDDQLPAARPLRTLPPAGTLLYTVVNGRGGPLFVTADQTYPQTPQIAVLDSSNDWARQPLSGLDELAVNGAQ